MALWHLTAFDLAERLLNLTNMPKRMKSIQAYARKKPLTPAYVKEVRKYLETLPAGAGAPPFKVAA